MIRRFFILTTIAIGLLLTGCGGSGGINPADLMFFYRITNAIPNVAGIDFVVQDGPTQTTDAGIGFAGSTAYAQTDLENLQIFFDVFEASTTNVIDSITVDKADEVSQHLFALGVVGGGPSDTPPAARLTPVNVVRTTPQGNVRIILVHGYVRLAPNPTPRIDLLRDTVPTPIATDIPFAGSSTFTLPAGTYDFKVRIAGLLSGTFLTKNGVVLTANKVYIFLVQGQEGDVGATAPDINIFEEPIRDP